MGQWTAKDHWGSGVLCGMTEITCTVWQNWRSCIHNILLYSTQQIMVNTHGALYLDDDRTMTPCIAKCIWKQWKKGALHALHNIDLCSVRSLWCILTWDSTGQRSYSCCQREDKTKNIVSTSSVGGVETHGPRHQSLHFHAVSLHCTYLLTGVKNNYRPYPVCKHLTLTSCYWDTH